MDWVLGWAEPEQPCGRPLPFRADWQLKASANPAREKEVTLGVLRATLH